MLKTMVLLILIFWDHAPTYWYKEGMTQQEANGDIDQCQKVTDGVFSAYEINRNLPWRNAAYAIPAGRPDYGPGQVYIDQKQAYLDQCMSAKGYRKVKEGETQ